MKTLKHQHFDQSEQEHSLYTTNGVCVSRTKKKTKKKRKFRGKNGENENKSYKEKLRPVQEKQQTTKSLRRIFENFRLSKIPNTFEARNKIACVITVI